MWACSVPPRPQGCCCCLVGKIIYCVFAAYDDDISLYQKLRDNDIYKLKN